MKYRECMIVWTPAMVRDLEPDAPFRKTAGHVAVVAWPDRVNASKGYMRSVGACFADVHKLSDDQIVAQVFIDFHMMVVRDNVHPLIAHQALREIDEYATRISPDIAGAREEE